MDVRYVEVQLSFNRNSHIKHIIGRSGIEHLSTYVYIILPDITAFLVLEHKPKSANFVIDRVPA